MVPRVVKEPSPSTNSFMTSPGEEGNDRTDNRSRKSRRSISSRSLHAECGSRSRVFSPRKLKLARARCCARAASGHATAAPPRRVMKSRRFTQSPRRRRVRPGPDREDDRNGPGLLLRSLPLSLPRSQSPPYPSGANPRSTQAPSLSSQHGTAPQHSEPRVFPRRVRWTNLPTLGTFAIASGRNAATAPKPALADLDNYHCRSG